MARNRRKTLENLISDWEPLLRRAFLASIDELRGGINLKQLTDAIRRGAVAEALRLVHIEPAAYSSLTNSVREAYDSGGKFAVSQMPPLKDAAGASVLMRFDVRDLAAEEWISEHSSKLISEITEDTRQSVQDVLTQGLVNGDNPTTTARKIAGKFNPATGRREGGILGLTNAQRKSIDKAADELLNDPGAYLKRKLRNQRYDRYVEKALKSNEPIPADVRQRMINALTSRTEKYRADMVGRTESMTALHASQREAYEQAIRNGYARPEEIEREWQATSGEPPTRESHIALDGQRVKFDEPYVSPVTGAKLMYPGDPNAPADEVINCRCWEVFRINYLKRIKG